MTNDEYVSLMGTDPEEMFPPVAGGAVDTVRRLRAAEQDQADANAAEQGAPIYGTPYSAVRVRPEAPDTGTARTVTLTAAYPVAQILAADPRRRSAVILAIDSDVYLTGSQGLAQDVAGSTQATQVFYLPAGIAVPVDNQGEYWVAATTTATNTRVSVMISRDSSQ
jgi:hypothetical protein